MLDIIRNDTYSRLEKLILPPFELCICLKYLKINPTGIKKTIAQRERMYQDSLDQETLECIEEYETSYEPKLKFALTFKAFVEKNRI